ncbi:MAG: preprotein translocase subunit SecG [Clostridia bacterium]|nr:preprotein translocase subunit SecG [Clostridia bacterium]
MKFASFFMNLLAPLPSEAIYYTYRAVSLALIIAMGVAAIAAIVLVMLQPGNSRGIDALGGSSETFYGKNKGKSTEEKLKLGTLICLGVLAMFAIVFFILQISAVWGA